ncbi:F0F1 ATP synthase subunit B [Alkalicoccus urumqiensis]|uniref:ATP synthase subunit b n=1 Tax=Alkalicoccus urumqiensis TaxID=1548213 RepID=A0A2P6MHP5_ALKUR|nr:F0F1 ATP synthase subunit B [Alkalicoccus urumqiensis]PRO65768.1 ATP synthase F0 subunit B [Alkalicoccus urumqiensis]
MFDITEIEWLNAVYQIAAFFVLLVLLKKYAFGPVMDMMEKREKHVADQIATAEKNREESEKYLKEQRDAVQGAREEAKEIVENSKKMSEQQAADIVKSARLESDRMKEAAKQEIQTEKAQAISALREQVSTLSVLVAAKVIEKELDEQEQERLIQETLREVGDDL